MESLHNGHMIVTVMDWDAASADDGSVSPLVAWTAAAAAAATAAALAAKPPPPSAASGGVGTDANGMCTRAALVT